MVFNFKGKEPKYTYKGWTAWEFPEDGEELVLAEEKTGNVWPYMGVYTEDEFKSYVDDVCCGDEDLEYD